MTGVSGRMGRIHAFLRGDAPDGRNRRLPHVLAFDNAALEATHDYIQWLFPLREPSRAVPGSPVLTETEAAAIRADPHATAGLAAALARMTAFYEASSAWQTAFDHNHLRITRILTATRDLLGAAAAHQFHNHILNLDQQPGSRVNAGSREHWRRALG